MVSLAQSHRPVVVDQGQALGAPGFGEDVGARTEQGQSAEELPVLLGPGPALGYAAGQHGHVARGQIEAERFGESMSKATT